MSVADESLLRRWSEHADAEAFAELVRRHAAMVHAVCRRVVGDRGLAEDLAQECFLALARGAATPDNLPGWLHRVATNRALSALRARRRDVAPIGEGIETRTPDDLAAWREVEAHVDAAIATLPDAQRALVVAHFLEGRSHRELARAFGVPQRTIGGRIERGVEAVRAALRRRGIRVEALALAGWLAALPRDAVPPVLLAGLGRLAVAGPVAVVAAGAAKTAVVGVAALVVLAFAGTWFALRPSAAPVRSNGAAATAPRTAGPAAQVAAETEEPVRSIVPGGAPARPTAPATLTGHVRTPDGQPVADADVVLVEVPIADGRRFLDLGSIDPRRVTRATSDAQGGFVIARLDPGRDAWASASRDGMVGERRWVQRDADLPLVLELEPGRTLHGRVSAPDGSAVTGALVSIDQCWSAADYARGSGAVLTDTLGEFAVGVASDSVACTLRVSATAHGEDVFVGVPTDAFADLRWQRRAVVRGRVAGMTTDRVGQIEVEVAGSLDDPPVPVFRTGLRPIQRFTARVAADGSYAVEDVQPGLSCEALLVALEQQPSGESVRRRVSPATFDRFTLAPGEVVERDLALEAPIVVRGRVTTAASHRPVRGARLEVSKDGTTLWDAYVETDADGRYEARLTAGGGAYRLRASPSVQVGRDDVPPVERRFAAGDTAAVDFELPEPIVLEFRVVDARGTPVESVQTELEVTTADGRRAGIGDSRRLDAAGRSRIELFGAIASARLEVQRFPRGPRTAATFAVPDALELTLVLPDACDVTGVLQDADGLPIAAATVTVDARYDDGGTDRYTTTTDRAGRFDAAGAFRAAHAELTIALRQGRAATAELPATPAGQCADLGVLVAR